MSPELFWKRRISKWKIFLKEKKKAKHFRLFHFCDLSSNGAWILIFLSCSLHVAVGEVLIPRLSFAVAQDGAVNATSTAVDESRRVGKGIQWTGRGGRQRRSQGCGWRGAGRGGGGGGGSRGGGLAAGQGHRGGSLLTQKSVITEGGGEQQGLCSQAGRGQAC